MLNIHTWKKFWEVKKEYYTLYISFVHWGHEKTTDNGTGGEQLLIRGDNYPYEFAIGYYNKSSIFFKIINLKLKSYKKL